MEQPQEPDFYSVFGVSVRCSSADIRSRYYKLCKMHHPDQIGIDIAKSHHWTLIQKAYRCLSNPARRKVYDIRSGFTHQMFMSPQQHIDELIELQRTEAHIQKANMSYAYETILKRERSNNGLIVLEALYGNLRLKNQFLLHPNRIPQRILPEHLVGPFINVTIPLQCLVENGKLCIYQEEIKSELEGFFNPLLAGELQKTAFLNHSSFVSYDNGTNQQVPMNDDSTCHTSQINNNVSSNNAMNNSTSNIGQQQNSGMEGDYDDPSSNGNVHQTLEDKVEAQNSLYIRYLFNGLLHETSVMDKDALRAPLVSHKCLGNISIGPFTSSNLKNLSYVQDYDDDDDYNFDFSAALSAAKKDSVFNSDDGIITTTTRASSSSSSTKANKSNNLFTEASTTPINNIQPSVILGVDGDIQAAPQQSLSTDSIITVKEWEMKEFARDVWKGVDREMASHFGSQPSGKNRHTFSTYWSNVIRQEQGRALSRFTCGDALQKRRIFSVAKLSVWLTLFSTTWFIASYSKQRVHNILWLKANSLQWIQRKVSESVRLYIISYWNGCLDKYLPEDPTEIRGVMIQGMMICKSFAISVGDWIHGDVLPWISDELTNPHKYMAVKVVESSAHWT